MSLAEYLKLCKASGMVPLIGVNYNCHNYQRCNETKEQTIPRAVRQVEFVVKEGFPGAFWYLAIHAPRETAHSTAVTTCDTCAGHL
jgi:hypothetical protein